ncbi:SIS domain-containing protein [Hydrocarboniphaga effusa]|uniref:SIS domain-containing protein n=1 Tax=Hydrocarboniphaga effusa TaxID=243629 RepID=UPI00398BCDF5
MKKPRNLSSKSANPKEQTAPAPVSSRNPFLERIKGELDRLRKSERAVAEFVLAQSLEVLNLSIAETASRVGVSQPTVARFSAALGFSGFREFKLRLAQSLAAGVPFVHQDVNPDDKMAVVAQKVFDSTIGALMSVRNHCDPARIQQAVDILAKARRIEFYGIGNSGIVAQDGQLKFFRFGIPSVAYLDGHSIGMAATVLKRGDAVVAVSATGRTSDIIGAAEIARECGAAVIAVTPGGSPLSKQADIALNVDVPEDPDVYAPMTTRLAHLAVLDVLSVGVALALGPSLLERLERSKRTLRDKRIGLPESRA